MDLEAFLKTHHLFQDGHVQLGCLGSTINIGNLLAAVFIATGQDPASISECAHALLIVHPVTKQEMETRGLYCTMEESVTVEPLNKRHVRTRSLSLREFSFIWRLKCTGIIRIRMSRFVLYREISFIRSILYRRLHCIMALNLYVGGTVLGPRVSGGEGVTYSGLYVCLTLPGLVIGTVGGGTQLATQKECLSMMGCYGKVSKLSMTLEILCLQI